MPRPSVAKPVVEAAEAFDGAALAFLCAPPFRHNDDAARFMNAETVAQTITERGVPAFVYPDAETLLPPLLETVQPGDVVLIMSNGSFGGLHNRLLASLEKRVAKE